MKKFLIIVLLSIFGNLSFGSTSDCPKGFKAFELMQYHKAITEFEKCLSGNDAEPILIGRLADSYRILDNNVKASFYYKMLLDKSSTSTKTKYWYATTLLATGQSETYRIFIDSMTVKYAKDKDFLRLKSAMSINENRENYEVIPASFNSPEADYAAVVWRDKVIFSSTNIKFGKKDLFTGQTFSSLLVFDTKTSLISELAPELPLKYNIGSATFSFDGKAIYFTTNRKNMNKKSAASLMIMHSNLVGNKWTTPIPFIHNNMEFNFAHPTISPNGKMLVFSSDSYYDFGMDLYYCSIAKTGYWSQPKRFENNINTTFNEVFPVFLNDSTLTYSSDGQAGNGGLDIYKTSFSNGTWTDGTHLGLPFNSEGDDYFLFSTDNLQTGYFTSNRNQPEGNEDIYYFKKNQNCILVVGLYDLNNDEFIVNLPIQISENKDASTLFLSLQEGFIFYDLKNGIQTEVTTTYKGSNYSQVTSSKKCKNDTIKIVFEYKDAFIELAGKVIDFDTKIGFPGVIVYFTDTLSKEIFTARTDSLGHFKIQLPENKFFTYNSKISGYLDESGNLKTSKSKNNPEIEMIFKKQKVNQAFVLKNILYDFDKWNIRPDAATELDRLVSFLNENSEIHIELSSHTDSRGNDRYNQKLSGKRAASAVAYLVDKGVKKERLKSKGYGEAKFINECKNGVFCEEEIHLQNRRTEIKILNTIN